MNDDYGTIEENEEQRHTKLGEENGKRALKKQQKKNQRNQTIKALWTKAPLNVKVIIIVLVALIGFVLLCAGALYILELDDDNKKQDEEYSSIVSSSINITSSKLQLSDIQINTLINNYSSSDVTLKLTMVSNIEKIIQWQNNYKYSAALLITIAYEEGITASEFDSFLIVMNAKAQLWNQVGYKTIEKIAQNYVGDETTKEWANNIENKMQQNLLNAGIVI